MRYRLRYQQHDFELAEGQFLIGRNTECQLALDDPLVSRNHAKVMVYEDKVTVEDLGSRNGVKVNGKRVEGAQELEHGARITIGSQEMVLLRKREVQTDTMVQQPPTQRPDPFVLLSSLADKALTLGHGDEAERLLGQYLKQVRDDVENGHQLTPEVIDRSAEYAVKLASVTGKGVWVDYVFRVYTALRRPCAAVVVDALYDALRKVKAVDRGMLRSYSELLRKNAASLNPTERFLLSRIEGLERLIGLR